MAYEHESEINKIQWWVLAQQASRFTYCLINQSDAKIGTAIAIHLGQRFFFATAKHVIDNAHKLEILSRNSVTSAITSDFVARHCHQHIDIGLIELKPDAAERFGFADRTQLQPKIEENQELPTLVIGYPSQFIRSTETQLTSDTQLRICRCDALIYRSVMLPQSEWPDDDLLVESLVVGRDMLVDFKPESRIKPVPPGKCIINTTEVDCPELDPHGLSGAGIWLAQVEDRNGLQLPDVRLIGIQTGWYNRNGWLRSVRIGEWLNLVQSKYPEMTGLI